jgi:hypothetical protein
VTFDYALHNWECVAKVTEEDMLDALAVAVNV